MIRSGDTVPSRATLPAPGSEAFQINLWEGFGGSEVYTRFLSLALQSLGLRTTAFVNARARHWKDLDFGAATLLPVDDPSHIHARLPERDALVFTNFPLGGSTGQLLKSRHRVVTFAHQPLYAKDLKPYRGSALVVANSLHVQKSVDWAGLPCFPEPLYGVADVARLKRRGSGALVAESRYAWDQRKLRDRMLSWFEPAWRHFADRPRYEKRAGLSIGIVSRLVPIKQFPRMFSILAPVIARHPGVWLEVFGSGGYASVRDITRSLAPIRDRVRFWGHQADVQVVYRSVDFVLSGLPEREGMGRNLIEAQMCGTPVLAVNAPPFTETVVDGVTGHLFKDPREDAGRDFAALLERLVRTPSRPDPADAPAHLQRFSQATFNACIERLVACVA